MRIRTGTKFKLPKLYLVGVFLIIALFFFLSNLAFGLVYDVALGFSLDKEVKLSTLYVIYCILFIDTIFLYSLIYFRKCFNAANKKIKIILLLALFELLAYQMIFFFDRRPAQTEYHSVSILNAIQLFVASLISWKTFKKTPKSKVKLKYFWLAFAFGMLFLALDENFRIHEQISDDFMKPRIEDTKIGQLIIETNIIDILLTTIYFIFAVIFFSFFITEFFRKYSKLFIWLFMLGFVFIFFQIISERLLYYYAEEYLELLASFSFIVSLLYLDYEKSKTKTKIN